MKNRNILFGYQYQNGNIIINQVESATVIRVYQEYLKGASLMRIADRLNTEKIEYMPGMAGWNKARLKRMIEDERYLGNEKYSQIIDSQMFYSVQKIKFDRNTQKDLDRKADIFKINVPVICPVCGNCMSRRHDTRRKCQDVWTCKASDCRHIIEISDKDLINQITTILNMVIAAPNIIMQPKPTESVMSMSVKKLENEIGNALDSHTINKDILKKKMFECITLKYDEIDPSEHINEMLKVNFEHQDLLSAFSDEVFTKAVSKINLFKNGNLSLILINGQEIGKENDHNGIDSNLTEEGNIHSTHGKYSERKDKQTPSDPCGGILPSINAG